MFFASQRKKKLICVRERERDERERERETGGERQSRPVWQDISHIMKMDHGELARCITMGISVTRLTGNQTLVVPGWIKYQPTKVKIMKLSLKRLACLQI